MRSLAVGPYRIGPNEPVFVIAEAGVNHNGNIETAKQLIRVAAEAGAHAVKFQTFSADRLVVRTAPKAAYQRKTTDAAESQHAMLKRLELSEDDHRVLKAEAERLGVLFLSTPFDQESVDLLVRLGISAMKVASGELTNLPLLRRMAATGLPILLSTGMATLGEIEEALEVIAAEGNEQVALLHCVSNYPTRPEDTNLRAMVTMQQAFQLPVGYSDHTEGLPVTFAAVAMGAAIIEKHFTLDKSLPGPDHEASVEPHELALMVQGIQRIRAALGDGQKRPRQAELEVARVARKSLIAAVDIPENTVISAEKVTIMRPGTGLPPKYYDHILGRRTRVAIKAGQVLTWDLLL